VVSDQDLVCNQPQILTSGVIFLNFQVGPIKFGSEFRTH
jgi:hypothetical protein